MSSTTATALGLPAFGGTTPIAAPLDIQSTVAMFDIAVSSALILARPELSPQSSATKGLELRRALASDQALIEQIYAASRDAEMRRLDWPSDLKQAFLRDQCALQASHYAAHYPSAHFLIIERAGVALGRLYWQWKGLPSSDDYALHLLEITLLTEHRGQGLAGALIRGLQAQARHCAASMTLYVEPHSRAIGIYQHLGFKPVSVQAEGDAVLMQWRAREWF
jgi:ribosomal protein S18 acetylase RimI-like enzyme